MSREKRHQFGDALSDTGSELCVCVAAGKDGTGLGWMDVSVVDVAGVAEWLARSSRFGGWSVIRVERLRDVIERGCSEPS
jgi:hypothetical protein